MEQSAFVPGRLLTCLGCIRMFACKTWNNLKFPLCAVKLDMMKAYDRVEWNYLKEILLRMGFRDSWVEMIMRCVSSASFRVQVNGKLSRRFEAARGIRQVYPFGVLIYSFVLCAEGFSAMLR